MIVSGEQPRDSDIYIHVSILPQTPLPFRLQHHVELSSLCYTVGPCWLSVLNIAVLYVTRRGGWRVQLLATQKSINRPGGWKGNFALFQIKLATGGREGGGYLSKGRPPLPLTSGGESFYRQIGVGGFHAETAQSSLTVIFKLVICGLTSIIWLF